MSDSVMDAMFESSVGAAFQPVATRTKPVSLQVAAVVIVSLSAGLWYGIATLAAALV